MSKTKLYILSTLFVFTGMCALAQNPNLISISTSNTNGTYTTGDTIHLEAKFDDWISSPSTLSVQLNTGDTVDLKFEPSKAEDILDPNWGVPGKRNATLAGGHNSLLRYGVYRILELEGKNGNIQNKGLMVLAGGFMDYEEDPGSHDMMVVTYPNGYLLKGYGDYLSNTSTGCFNREVHWVIETQDGGLLVGGEFIDYGGNRNYDYIIKFKSDLRTIDKEFMENLTQNSTQQALNGAVGRRIDSWGKPQNCIMEDTDGSIYLAGAFSRVGGITHRGIVKLNPDGSVNNTFNAVTNGPLNTIYGHCIAFDDDNPEILWFGEHRNAHQMDKNTGELLGSFTGGPAIGIMGITLLPNSNEGGSGGALLTGRGSTNGGWTNMVAIGDNMNVLPYSQFNLGSSDAGAKGPNLFGHAWAIDGVAFVKGKMWIGMHDSQPHSSSYYAGLTTGNNYYEGALVALNYDGTLATSLNHMLANPNNGSNADGVGGYGNTAYNGGITNGDYYFSGGGTDIISLYVNKNDQLMVGGSFASVMQYSDDAYGTQAYSYPSSPDDQIIIRMDFTRVKGYFIVDDSDHTPRLTIDKIIPNTTVIRDIDGGHVGASLPTDPGLAFDNNHHISINSSPLDITLSAFDVSCIEDGKVMIEWETLSETNNDFFSIESSADGKRYEELARYPGSGCSSEARSYQLIVDNPKEHSYFRLKQTDYDGSSTFFDAMYNPCRKAHGSLEVSVYPNPAKDILYVRNADAGMLFEVVNPQGKRLLHGELSDSNIDISSLPKGLYIIRLYEIKESNRMQAFRIIVI